MLDKEELFKAFVSQVKWFDKTFDTFAKTGPRRRTAAYKKTRLDEGTEAFLKFTKTCLELDKRFITNTPDPCYVEDKERITSRYDIYMKELNQIPDTPVVNQPSVELSDGKVFYQQQRGRMDALLRAMEDVEQRAATDGQFTVAYCKLKSKIISEAWLRVQVAEEESLVDREDIPIDYEGRLQDLEMNIEATLLILQEGMEQNEPSKTTEGLKLPRMTIPKFNGDYFKWTTFRDLFKPLVNDNKNLSDGQKMQLLKGNVIDDAETLIRDITVADGNFEGAWSKLVTRFENKRVVVFKYLNKLMTQPQSKTDSKSIKKLLDTTDQILMALKNIGRPVDAWDDWIVFTITQKLSDECRKDWERKLGNSTEIPEWKQLQDFLEEEFRMLESVENNTKRNGQNEKVHDKQTGVKAYQASMDNAKYPCPVCEEHHGIFSCGQFKAMEPKQRWEMAKKTKLCFLCLRKHKDAVKCDKKKPCKKCDRSHSTWLHEERKEALTTAVGLITNAFGALKENKKQVLLATTLVSTVDNYGRRVTLRALIDSGSQGSMVTSKAASMLRLVPIPTNKQISGLGGNKTGKLNYLNMTIKPRFQSNVQLTIECYVLKMLTKTLPDTNLCIDNWHHLKGLKLADPTFNKMGPIDLLLGNDVVSDILLAGFIKGAKGSPMAQETSFGWIVSGNIDPSYPKQELKCLVATSPDDDISRFWELEELNPKRALTPDEKECEEFYKQTFSRDEQGLFTVKIPFKLGNQGPERLGSSKGQSLARFMQLEKRFARDEKLYSDYTAVMREYIALGHMKPVDQLDESHKLYYIPHHAVLKPDSLTTKTRVVFDASAKTTTGVSLNDCMHTGAKQQNDLFDTVLWRENPKERIGEYHLTTATFGTAAAPFMATRTLNQIAMDERETYPVAAQIIEQDFYVDDLISGGENLECSLQAKDELINALKRGGLRLRKWSSNSQELLKSLPEGLTEKSLQAFEENDATKALGLQWNPKTDQFNFKIKLVTNEGALTKRKLLSEASKIFDPLGWLAPVVIKPKLIMQEIWELKLDWDDEIPTTIKETWIQFRDELPNMSSISIDRWIAFDKEAKIELHGFCDASEIAYAAVVYT